MTEDLRRAVRTVMVDCLAIRDGEAVLVVTDPARRSLAEALSQGARALGADAVLMEMAERATHGTEPPRAVAAAMLECDVLVAPTTKSLSHTEARRAASAGGVRAATMPQITEEMLVRTMAADYGRVRRRSAAVAARLDRGSEVHVTSEAGTDLTLSIEGRAGIRDDGDLRSPGAFGNLPAGEGFIAPVEGSARGVLVVDGTVWPVGRLSEPLRITIEAGYAVAFDGPASADFQGVLEPHGSEAFAVGELGIGTNETARLSGNVLEDEKVLGTVHVAFGDNHSFGGEVRVSSHQDGILVSPTLAIDGEPVVDRGKLLV